MITERNPLSEYHAKRSLDKTPEPTGGLAVPAPASGGGAFVIHKHNASRLHYDLRLEMDGALESWAVPKGPALDPAEKRLAVHVEQHPLEYVDFEAVIPEGQYGAGGMIAWDRGVWRPLEDARAGLRSGKLLFELRGYKLRGVWTLVKLKSERDWLLIREKRLWNPAADPETLPETSVLSGRTVEELEAGIDQTAALAAECASLGAPRRRVAVDRVGLMLAHAEREPFDREGWVFELKLDGFRMLAAARGGIPRLVTRNGNDATAAFPEITAVLAALPIDDFVLDGEVVVHDDAGRPSFEDLQQRSRLRRTLEIKRASLLKPATFYAFDAVGCAGHDLRRLPLLDRKAVLATLLPPAGPLRFVDHYTENGVEVFHRIRALGLEGVVGKDATSPYRAGRSRRWLKVRADRTDDFVIVGFTDPAGSRKGFGALHLAAWREGGLVYAGRVGSGFSDSQLEEIAMRLESTIRPTPQFFEPAPTGDHHHWTTAEIVCEVRFLAWTSDGHLRQPVFLRLRDDKPAAECVLAATAGRPAEPAFEPPAAVRAEEVTLTNPDKVFWPESGYTKGDLFGYYRAVAPFMLPYLKNRALVLTRYPDGIEGKSFYQKNAPGFAPAWIRTERVWSDSSEREIEYFVCDDEATLLYLANLGAIPIHLWGSRVDDLDHPDWCVLDLDPKEAPFEHVVEVARALHVLCGEIGLPHYVKTSGSTGLHVMIPLARRFSYEHARTLGELLARVVIADLSAIATLERVITAREGRVYIDVFQNRRGQLIAAPFCVRPIAGAPVSTPLRWREVRPGLDIRRFTIRSVPRRLAAMKRDPLRPLLDDDPDLAAALDGLRARLPRKGIR